MTFRRATVALLLVAGLVSGPAVAQQQSQPQRGRTDNIVVTGRAEEKPPPTHDEISRQARKITQGSDFRHSPLARWEGALCPGILGMVPEYAGLMIDRIRDAAHALDIRLAEDGKCQANLIIAFVEDGKAELTEIAKQRPYLFDQMENYERKALLKEEGPVRVWTSTMMRTRDGMPIPKSHNLTSPPQASMWMAHSKIYLPVQNDIDRVIVFYDRAAVKGKTIGQLADYAVLRGLARTKAMREGTVMDSILTLFDPDASPPLYMTAFDKAYLAALYDSIPNLPGTVKIGGVNRQLRRQAAAEAKAE